MSLIPENIIHVKSEDKSDYDRNASPDSISSLNDHKRFSPRVAQNINAALDTPKFCNNCGIGFTYENTLAAHKKFYCKEIVKSDRPPSNTNVANISIAEASAL